MLIAVISVVALVGAVFWKIWPTDRLTADQAEFAERVQGIKPPRTK